MSGCRDTRVRQPRLVTPTTSRDHDAEVLVVGASASGLGVVERLRDNGFTGRIQVVGAEVHIPYDRPPLSKHVLSGQWAPERSVLRQQPALDALAAQWMLGRRAVDLDVDGHTIGLDDGRRVHYRTAVLATGLSPRVLSWQRPLVGVHVLRTIDDSLALRSDLLRAQRVVVVGAGVLGCEIAATTRHMGPAVTLVDPAPVPMLTQLGPELGAVVTRLHQGHGTVLRMGTGVLRLLDDGHRVTGVVLSDATTLPADVVVVAAGSITNTEWLADSGVMVTDGVDCDSRCRAGPDVYAAGDLARWQHRGLGRSIRAENRTNAIQQAITVADNILGAERDYTPTSYFWTDQYGVRIQVAGEMSNHANLHLTDGDLDQHRFAAVAEIDGRIVGAVGWRHPRGYGDAAGRIGGQPAPTAHL